MQASPYILREPAEKTRLLTALGLAGATSPLVRETAIALVRQLPHPGEGIHSPLHVARIGALHRFLASLPYFREPEEDFPSPEAVLRRGGDCDDQALLGVALAWALKYPAFAQAVGIDAEANAGHYRVTVGYPESESPEGDDQTRWLTWETTLPASRWEGRPK